MSFSSSSSSIRLYIAQKMSGIEEGRDYIIKAFSINICKEKKIIINQG